MREAGRIMEEILKYLGKRGSVNKEDIKYRFRLEKEKNERILKFLLDLKLIEIKNERIKITESGIEFLRL